MKMSIVLISYNRKDEIERSLSSMSVQTRKPDEIILVDNCSTDGTVEMVEKKFPHVKVIVLPENKGLCFAANVGFSNAKGEYVGIVESDMTISRNWVEEVIKGFEADHHAGIVCPYFLHWSKHGWIDCEYETPDDYLFMANGCFAVRKDIFEKAGQNLEDSEYFLYAQEEEVTARVFNMGYNVKRIRTAMTYHRPAPGKGRVKNKRWQFYKMRNDIWNLWTFFSVSNVVVMTPIYLISFMIEIKNPITFLSILGKTIAGVPHCLSKRQVPNMKRYLNVIENYRHIRSVQKTHYPFDYFTGEIDKRYLDNVIVELGKEL
jgi:GT2 family glycosyltransferase